MLFFLHHYEIPALVTARRRVNRNHTSRETFGNRSQNGVAVITQSADGRTSGIPRGESRQEVEGEELRHRQEAGRDGDTGVQ